MSNHHFPKLTVIAVLAAIAALAACSGGALAPSPATPPPTVAEGQGPVPSTAPNQAQQLQLQHGQQVFAQVCAQCHGSAGQGTQAAPALMGPSALPSQPRPGARLRTGPFRSAMDIGMFVKGSMPPGGPQRSMDEMKAVLAYLLQSNGVAVTQPISPAVAGTIPWNR